jgi:hypothetical protein
MDRPTALRIPSPWSGDERDPIPRSYWWWFALYRTTREIRHGLALHDWKTRATFRTCTWCGKVQRLR